MKGVRAWGAIFDMDGVIVDTGWAHKQAWVEFAHTHGAQCTDEFFLRTFGMQNYQIIPLMLGHEVSPEDLEAMGDWKEQRYRQIVAQGLTPAQGLVDLLADLKAHGFRIAVGSSAPKANIDLVLDRLGMRRSFDAIVYGDMVSRGKPAPDTFLAAARMLDVPPAQCVVVEDAVPGVQAGKAAGMAVVAITTTRTRQDLGQADLVIDRFAEATAEDFVKLLALAAKGKRGSKI
jgi:beta-phosphoglucomutase